MKTPELFSLIVKILGIVCVITTTFVIVLDLHKYGRAQDKVVKAQDELIKAQDRLLERLLKEHELNSR
jgi:hypothetical protein